MIGDPYVTILAAAREEIGVNFGRVGTMEGTDNIVVTRVVGQVHLTLASEDPAVVVHERIVVGILDDSNNFALWADDYNDATEANEPFTWTRIQCFPLTGDSNLTPPGIVHPFWSVIDSRVGRRLMRDQALFYVCQVVAGGGPDPQVRVTPWLRSWCSVR